MASKNKISFSHKLKRKTVSKQKSIHPSVDKMGLF